MYGLGLCAHERVIQVFIFRIAKMNLEWAHKQLITRVQTILISCTTYGSINGNENGDRSSHIDPFLAHPPRVLLMTTQSIAGDVTIMTEFTRAREKW